MTCSSSVEDALALVPPFMPAVTAMDVLVLSESLGGTITTTTLG